ncbi:MAG: radical SAM protein, partial [Deferrisomatales bacterium]
LGDPTGDRRLRPLPHLVRKHRDRVVVLAADRCFFRCRFCFRRGETTPPPGPREWQGVVAWLRAHPEVEEVILSGGDPLTLPDRHLAQLARALAGVPSLRRWRLHTRAPVVLPARVTPGLLEAVSTGLPLRVVVHANHPAELRPAFLHAVGRLQARGVEVQNQSVLLAGVNDDPGVLARLLAGLAAAGVRTRYLHHPDRALGNARFRLSLERGLALVARLRAAAPAPLPPYVVDLPNGGGKCPAEHLVPVASERGPRGRRTRYRWARPPGGDAGVPDECFEWGDVWTRAASGA